MIDDATPLAEIGLSPRVVRILAPYDFKTAGDVRNASDGELIRCRGLGRKALYEIRKLFPNPENNEFYRECYGWDV